MKMLFHVTRLWICIMAGSGIFTMAAWSRVEMSTCEVPMENAYTHLCCYTENIPKGASIYIWNKLAGQNFKIVLRIKTGCVPDDTFAHPTFIILNYGCDEMGNETVYRVRISRTYEETAQYEWKCGFYGNQSVLTYSKNQVLTNYQGAITYKLTDQVILNWTIPIIHQIQGFEIHQPDGSKAVTYDGNTIAVIDGFRVVSNISTGLVEVEITNVSTKSNGTYVCIYLDTSKGVVRDGVTLVVLERPKVPRLTNSKPVVVSPGIVSARVFCNSSSLSAAPLYYRPRLHYTWIIPTDMDDPNFANVSMNGSELFMPNINCATLTSLPLYCQAWEGSLASYTSSAGYYSRLCNNIPSAPVKPPEQYDYSQTVLVAALFCTAFTLVSVLSITAVVKRKSLFKKLRRCCRKTCVCSRCCRNLSGSDSDSDLEQAIERSRSEDDSSRERRVARLANDLMNAGDDNNRQIGLGDGLSSRRENAAVEAALERIAIEESLQAQRDRTVSQEHQFFTIIFGTELSNLSGENLAFEGLIGEDNLSGLEGAVGGVPEPASPSGVTVYQRQRSLRDETGDFNAVERLLEQHNRHLDRRAMQVVINRASIVQDVFLHYEDAKLAESRVAVKMVGEQGMDCGGVADDMYTTFWAAVQEQYFQGYEAVVPYLPMNRWSAEERLYRLMGRILSHTVALTKALPLPLCKSAIIAMIFDTIDVDTHTVLQDFLFFLDPIDRDLVTTGINDFKSLSSEQIQELQDIFARFEYPAVIKEQSFIEHMTQLARNTVCIRPKPLLSLMREGIPHPHLQHFWGMLNVSYLEVMFLALKPNAERVIARLKTDPAEDGLNQRQKRAFRYLQDFLKELSQPEIETFLHFLTGKKTTPRQAIVVTFIHERGFKRAPKAHTCSNLLELPDTYENYPTFKSEFKHLLANSEAMTMTMA